MTVTIDPRPTYFGDRMIVTGTINVASSTTIDLTGMLASIDSVTVVPFAGAAVDEPHSIDAATGTKILCDGASGGLCKFMAIGRRT